MQIISGTIIISTPALNETNFGQSIILITENNEDGATGFIVNKLYPRALNQLIEFNYSLPFPLYNGGPVEQEGLFFIHRQPNLIQEGIAINNTIYLGGNFEQAVALINNQSMDESDIKMFIGYCGWNAGELEAEIAEGSWLITDESIDQIFATKKEFDWDTLYQKMVSK
jgi:putative transcriptional regulator